METNEFSSIWNHHKRLSQLFPIHLNTYVYGHYKYCYSYSAGIDFRRQILTTKVDLRAIRVKLLQSRRCLFDLNTIYFPHLKLQIALAIPAPKKQQNVSRQLSRTLLLTP